jgi:hypothetical protein
VPTVRKKSFISALRDMAITIVQKLERVLELDTTALVRQTSYLLDIGLVKTCGLVQVVLSNHALKAGNARDEKSKTIGN